MTKYILVFIFSIFMITPSVAKEILEGGTLQAYWAENWNDEGTINKPYLGLKYLTADKDKFIVLSIRGSKEKFIKKYFHNIPADFFKRKEWYITQQGDLTVYRVKEGMLCNNRIYDANVIGFKPDTVSPPVDTAPYEDTAHGGCNGDGEYPYITLFTAKDYGAITAEFKAAPSEDSPTIAKGNVELLVKIRKINKDWMYAGAYASKSPNLMSSVQGYVKTNNLRILN